MKRKTTKFIAVALVTVAICVLGLLLSHDNEYKKFLEMNKKALAEEGVPFNVHTAKSHIPQNT